MSTTLNLGTLALIAAGVIFVIVRQFREKQAKPLMLAIVPLLVAYHTYLSIQELASPIISPSLMVSSLVIGALLGALLGFFRGNVTRMRLDNETGTIYYCPGVANGLFWFGMLVIKVLAGVGLYLRLDRASTSTAVLLAIATGLFLGYVCMTCATLYWRISNISSHYKSLASK